MSTTADDLQDLYRTAAAVRTTGLTAEAAAPLYAKYLQFVRHHAPAGDLLDVGCGSGWTTYLFARAGYAAHGVDLNPGQFEPPPLPGLTLSAGSGLDLPFPDRRFDVVTTYQAIEHVPDPARMLDEMVRVARPGGVVCVVGPNLLGLADYLRAVTVRVWQNRPARTIVFRTPDMPRHPAGNTLPEALWGTLRAVGMIARRVASPAPRFAMRTPDLRPPFVADNDAVYWCNPLDLTRHLRRRGCTVLRDVALGRPGASRMLAAGTWVAARTPAGP